MQNFDFHVVHLADTGFGASYILRKGIMDYVAGSVAVMDKQGQVGGLAEVGDAARFLDWGSGELGLHELHIGAVVGGLLGSVGVGDGSRGRAIF